MPLSVADRKAKMPHGGLSRVAADTKADLGYVSRAFSGEIFPKSRRTKRKLLRVLRSCAKQLKLSVEDVFTPDELARADWAAAEPVAQVG